MSNEEKWTLTEGIQKLFALNAADGEPEIEDLVTYEHKIILDVSFAEIEVNEIDGVKIEPTKGISVLLTGENADWAFSRGIIPDEGETLPQLVKRIALALGIQPEEKVW